MGSSAGREPQFKTLIYEGELNRIAGWVEEYPNLETGGDLFGFWTHTGAPVVQFVLGPGPRSQHNSTSFYQDKEFLIEAGEALRSEHGLQHIGEWHSHHQLGLAEPSSGDANTVFNALQRYDFQKFVLGIANLKPSSGSGFSPFSSKKWGVNVGCFLFTNTRHNFQSGAWVLLPGESPIRSTLKLHQWKHSNWHFLKDQTWSDSWQGVIKQTTLEAEVIATTEPIKITEGLWYATSEGKALLKEIYDDFNQYFRNCQMLRTPLERIYFTFEDSRGKWRLELPDDFPKSKPYIQLDEKPIRVEEWRERDGSNLINLIRNQIDISYRGR